MRANASVGEYVNWVDYCLKLAGFDHIGVAPPDDFHRSYKDRQRIAPYVPSSAAELRKCDWSNDRVYRRAGIGASLLAGEDLAADSSDEIIRN